MQEPARKISAAAGGRHASGRGSRAASFPHGRRRDARLARLAALSPDIRILRSALGDTAPPPINGFAAQPGETAANTATSARPIMKIRIISGKKSG